MRTSAMVAVTIVLMSCSNGPGSAAPSATTVATPTRTPADAPTPSPQRLIVSARDDGRVLTVPITGRVILVLSNEFLWSDPQIEGGAVELEELVSDAPTGARTWDVLLREPGRAVIRAEGSPNPPGEPSETPRSFQVTLNVT